MLLQNKGRRSTMKRFLMILKRALLLRCPRCGRGKIFRRRFTTYEYCSACHFIYEREEGFYTGAIAINLIVAELLIAAFVVPFSVWAGLTPGVPFIPLMIALLPIPILLPFLFFRLTKSLWIGMVYWLNPPPLDQQQRA